MIHSCIFHRLQTTAPGTKNLCHQDNFSCFSFIKNVNACVCSPFMFLFFLHSMNILYIYTPQVALFLYEKSSILR